MYYREAKGVILVYGVDDKNSFYGLEYWTKELEEKLKDTNYKLAIVGNKTDLREN